MRSVVFSRLSELAMTNQIARSACSLALTALLALVSTAIAADKRDFSGSYTLKEKTGASKLEKSKASTLRVNQTESALRLRG